MKRWTRKLLAGLLSFGMLLQVASPLSALAADGGSAAHTLTVTVGSTEYILTSDGTGVTMPENWPSNYPAVSYNDGFVFSGRFDNNTDLLSIRGSENVTIRSTGTYTVKGDLTANVANLTVEKGSTTNPAIEGTADITCTGNVSISGDIDYSNISSVNKSVGKKLTVKSAQNVFIDGILNGGAEITCDTLKLNCGNGSTVRGELVVNNARKVTATAYALYGVIGDSGATGKLVLNNCTGIVKLVDEIETYAGLIRNGSVTVNPSDNVTYYASTSADGTGKTRVEAEACRRNTYQYFEINLGGQAQPTTHTLTLTNAKAYEDAQCTTELINATSANGTSTYHVDESETVYVKAEKPGENYHFTGWTGSNSKDEVLTLNITDDTTLTANWAEMHRIYIDGAPYKDRNGAEYFAPGTTVAIRATAPERDTLDIGYVFDKWEPDEDSADFTYGSIAGQQCNEKQELTYIVMPAGDVQLKTSWIKYYSLTTVECDTNSTHPSHPAGEEITITADETIADDAGNTRKLSEIVVAPKAGYTGEEIKATGSGGTYTFIMPAYPAVVTARYEEETVKTTHTLTLKNAKAYTDETYQTPLEPTTEGGNEYSVEENQNVYLKTEQPEEEARWGCYWYSETNLLNFGLDTDDLHSKTISFKMPAENMELEVGWYKLYDITANNEPYVFMDGTSDISKGWILALSCEKVAGYDQDTGYSAILWEKDAGSAEFEFIDGTNGNSWFPHIHVTSEGNVKLKVTFTESGYYKVTLDNNCTLVNENEDHTQYYQTDETVTVKVTEPADENRKLDKITVTLKKDGSTITPEKDAAGNYTFTMPNSPVTVTTSWKDSDGDDVIPDDTPATTDSGSDGGGAVAAVLVGGAAVWGGYEIATRVILHNILPEGAAIPANRGQLALLVWNNAGRPAPVNESVFVDMDDADMAKAAQWCVEQGIMEAKTAETFKPEGWTPKFKVIEVWNKAFPKQ